MTEIITVDLAEYGITLPSNRVGIVMAQPYLSITATEPVKCDSNSIQRQLQMIDKTFEVARARKHNEEKTHFTVFPEYSIPGLLGIERIESIMNQGDWPIGTIVIGGIDALHKEELVRLAAAEYAFFDRVHDPLEEILVNDWINCALIWIKGADGVVRRWIQPKLSPAMDERLSAYTRMHCGKSIYLFTGPFIGEESWYRFSTLICFDWIAPLPVRKPWAQIFENLTSLARDSHGEYPISWLFVIQNNKRPSHSDVLSEVVNFFSHSNFPSVRRDRTCLIFSNTAGVQRPGKSKYYGGSSVILSKQTLAYDDDGVPPTLSHKSRNIRASELLNEFLDNFFREKGECIHSFSLVNPSQILPTASGRAQAITNAFVFPIHYGDEPRAPRYFVPAGVKWINDEIDTMKGLGERHQALPLAIAANAMQVELVSLLRGSDEAAVINLIRIATRKSNSLTETDSDLWSDSECEALDFITDTLCILGIAFEKPVRSVGDAHASIKVGGRFIDVIAVMGDTHDECLEYSKKVAQLPQREILEIVPLVVEM